MKYLTIKPGQTVTKALEALLDGKLTAVKDARGEVTFTEEAKDSGRQVMTVTDVAALLQLPVSAIREMCKTRAQRGPHPLPFYKLNGKALRFDRTPSDAVAGDDAAAPATETLRSLNGGLSPSYRSLDPALCPRNGANRIMYVKSCSIKGEVKNIFLPPPEVRIESAISSPSPMRGGFGFGPHHC